MGFITPIDLLSGSMNIEKGKLNAAVNNLARINDTFDKKLDAKGVATSEAVNIPSVNQVLQGVSVGEVDSSLTYLTSGIEKKLSVQGGVITEHYKLDIELHEQILAMNNATRGYEASIKLFNIYKEMSGKTLTIGKY